MTHFLYISCYKIIEAFTNNNEVLCQYFKYSITVKKYVSYFSAIDFFSIYVSVCIYIYIIHTQTKICTEKFETGGTRKNCMEAY